MNKFFKQFEGIRPYDYKGEVARSVIDFIKSHSNEIMTYYTSLTEGRMYSSSGALELIIDKLTMGTWSKSITGWEGEGYTQVVWEAECYLFGNEELVEKAVAEGYTYSLSPCNLDVAVRCYTMSTIKEEIKIVLKENLKIF